MWNILYFFGILVAAASGQVYDPNQPPVVWATSNTSSTVFVAVVNPGLVFAEAEQYCQECYSGHLAMPANQTDYDTINDLQVNTLFTTPWIGLQRSSQVDPFLYVTGDIPDQNTTDRIKSTDDDSEHDCVTFYFAHSVRFDLLRTRSCDSARSFICSFERPTVPYRLGIEDGRVPVSSLTASTSYNDNHSPASSRLNQPMQFNGTTWAGAWCVRAVNTRQWIEVDLLRVAEISGVITQGRDSPTFLQWVESYNVTYSLDGTDWLFVQQMDSSDPQTFIGNSDQDTEVENAFNPWVEARFVRLLPVTWYSTICARWELVGVYVAPPLDDSLSAEQQTDLVAYLEYDNIATLGNYSYTLVGGTSLGFAEADQSCCLLTGGHLASLTTIEEENLLYGLSGDYSYVYTVAIWVGFYRVANEFLWTDGETGAPASDISGSVDQEDYQCFTLNIPNSKWSDAPCTALKNFICKFETNSDSSSGDCPLQDFFNLAGETVASAPSTPTDPSPEPETTGATITTTPGTQTDASPEPVTTMTTATEPDINGDLAALVAKGLQDNSTMLSSVEEVLSDLTTTDINDDGLNALASLSDMIASSNISGGVKVSLLGTIASQTMAVNQSVLSTPSNRQNVQGIRSSLETEVSKLSQEPNANTTYTLERITLTAVNVPARRPVADVADAGGRGFGLVLKIRLGSAEDGGDVVSIHETAEGASDQHVVDTLAGKFSEDSASSADQASIHLPASIQGDQSDNGSTVSIAVFLYANDALFPAQYSRRRQVTASVVTLEVVIGDSDDATTDLSDPILIAMGNTDGLALSPWSRSCGTWLDDDLAWSSDGLSLAHGTEPSFTVCQSTHLSSFTVLMDSDIEHQTDILDVITTVGCSLSIIALVLTFVSFLCSGMKLKTPQKILLNLSAALIGLYCCLFMVDQVGWGAGCLAVGALTHYFQLAAFAWMTVEGVNMYLLFVKVFNADVRHFMLIASIASWGIPLLVVIIVLSVDYSQYRGIYSCFLGPGLVKYITVHGVIALLLTVNLVIFVLVIRVLVRSQTQVKGKSSQNNRKDALKRLQSTLMICCLLGLTWAFGFLMAGGAWSVFAALFCLNAFQGVVLGVFFCLLQPQIKDFWKRQISRLTCGRVYNKLDKSAKARPSVTSMTVETEKAM